MIDERFEAESMTGINMRHFKGDYKSLKKKKKRKEDYDEREKEIQTNKENKSDTVVLAIITATMTNKFW